MGQRNIEIWVHIILTTRYRRPWLDTETERVAFTVIRATAARLGGWIEEIEGAHDHAHILARLPPDKACSAFVAELKRCSSAAVSVKLEHRAGFRWGRRFGAFSASHRERSGLRDYIRRQKQHHAGRTFDPAMELS